VLVWMFPFARMRLGVITFKMVSRPAIQNILRLLI
jgi:hypothetical protein